jgi:hypothetical protein
MGWVSTGTGWYSEGTVRGKLRTTLIPGPATAVLALVMRAETDRQHDA